jgi:hypothetical protein
MPSILIWTPESDYDRDAVKEISMQIVRCYNIQCEIKTSTKEAYNRAVQKDPKEGLKDAVCTYLKEYDCVIFLIDSDGIQSKNCRRNEENSYLNQIKKVVNQKNIFLVEIMQGLEAWLLIDCLGICCFYNNNTNTRDKKEWKNLANKYQRGETERIIEAEAGGKGAKEYLEDFSDEINLKINPKLKDKLKNLKSKRYRERDSPQIVKHILINESTIKRNSSLQNFSSHLQSMASGN